MVKLASLEAGWTVEAPRNSMSSLTPGWVKACVFVMFLFGHQHITSHCHYRSWNSILQPVRALRYLSQVSSMVYPPIWGQHIPAFLMITNREGYQWVIISFINILLVGGFNPSEKYESQLGLLFPIYGRIQNVPNHQPVYQYFGCKRFK